MTSLIDTNDFNIGLDSSINYILTGRTDSVFLLDSFRLDDLSDTNHSSLPDFLIRNLVSDSACLNAEEVTGQQLQDTAIYIQVDTISFLFIRTINLSNLRNVSIATCVVRLNVTNGTRLSFDSVVCQINNLEPIIIYDFDSLATESLFHRFNNFNLDSTASFVISVFSPGTGTDSILASTRDSVTFGITLDSLRINSGSFRAIPAKPVRSTKLKIYTLPSNYTVRINNLAFNSGDLFVSLENHFPFFCSLQVMIPELDFDTLVLLPAFDSTYCELGLANRIYHNESDSLTPLTLRTIAIILLDTVYTNIGPEHYINTRYRVSDIEIDSLAGTIIDTIGQSFSMDSIHLNLPDFLSRVETVNAYAMLDITNAIAFPLTLQLAVIGYNDTGDSTVIDTVLSVLAGTPALPEHSFLVLDCDELFNIHPSYALINARVSSVGSGWMNRVSYSTADYTISSPLRVVLHSDTITFDPETISLGSRVRNTVRDYAESGEFHAWIMNHIPVSLSGKMILENIYSAPLRTVDININIPAGITDNSGLVTQPSDTNISFSLDEEQTRIFSDSLVSVRLELYIPETDTITITARDYFRVRNSYARIETRTYKETTP